MTKIRLLNVVRSDPVCSLFNIFWLTNCYEKALQAVLIVSRVLPAGQKTPILPVVSRLPGSQVGGSRLEWVYFLHQGVLDQGF